MLKTLIENNGAEVMAESFIGMGCDEAAVGLNEGDGSDETAKYQEDRLIKERKQLSMLD